MDAFDNRPVRALYKHFEFQGVFLTKLEDARNVAFQCSPFTGKFYERSGQVPARRRGGLSDLSDRRVTKEELFLICCYFCHSALQM